MPSDTTTKSLKTRIRTNEGLRHKAYKDSLGNLTAGYGRNLEAIAFTDGEVNLMFENDFSRAAQGARSFAPYDALTAPRQGVIIEMVYQLGVGGVRRFTRFWKAVESKDWSTAKLEMLDSQWHTQTPERCEALAEIFYVG